MSYRIESLKLKLQTMYTGERDRFVNLMEADHFNTR